MLLARWTREVEESRTAGSFLVSLLAPPEPSLRLELVSKGDGRLPEYEQAGRLEEMRGSSLCTL